MIQKLTALIAAIYLLITGFIASPSQYYFSDWQAYQNLQPNSVAAGYINKLELTDKAKLIEAGADPKIEPKAQFNALCQPAGQMIELGCYLTGLPDHIYIMQVNDPAVSKIMDVTAAHEFLHAAYARLTPQKKDELNAMIEKQLPLINDPNLTKRLAGYAKTEPGQQDNELHSIFGTEYAGLTPELESYYKQYFNDRTIIVAWSQANTAYINGKEQYLKDQKSKIEADDASLKSIESRMNGYLSSGEVALYNSLVPTQNAQVRALNAEIVTYNTNIAAYNDLIASISNQTYSSFDTVK